jgi:anti-sigma regulatory factor (Ser/Thr protein kinase)
VRHGTGRVALRVEAEDGVVKVRVHDDDAEMPVVEDADLASVRGRGLFIVECLADQWASTRTSEARRCGSDSRALCRPTTDGSGGHAVAAPR